MFPFRKPPTKLELAKKGVSDAAHHLIEAIPTHQIEEKLGDLKKGAVLAAGAASVAAHHAGEVAAHKLGELQNAASHLGESAAGVTQTAQTAAQTAAALAAAKASAASQTARETAQTARETLGEKAKTLSNLKERAVQDFAFGSKEAQNAKAVAQKAAEREAEAVKARVAAVAAKKQAKNLEKAAEEAQKDADNTAWEAKQAAKAAIETQVAKAKERAKVIADAAAEVKAQAEAKKQQLDAQAREAAEALSAKIEKNQADVEAKAHDQAEKAANALEIAKRKIVSSRDETNEGLAEVQVSEGGSKLGWILLGLAVGVVLAIFLAPTSGRRSRAAIKDRLGKVGDGAVDAATATADKVVDIAQRVEGLTHKVEAKLAADGAIDNSAAGGEETDDTTIADRVRSILGHHEVAKQLDRLNIDCVDGVVTLRGPALDETTQETLLTAIKTVPGVKDAIAEFSTD